MKINTTLIKQIKDKCDLVGVKLDSGDYYIDKHRGARHKIIVSSMEFNELLDKSIIPMVLSSKHADTGNNLCSL